MVKRYKVLNAKKILEMTPHLSRLSITLKKIKNKGYGIVATKPIKKNQVIAYYQFKVHDMDTYESPTDSKYNFFVKTKNDHWSKKYMGDVIYNKYPPLPKRNIPYWAQFSNEPSKGQTINCDIDFNLKENYRNRDRVRIGDIMVYKLVATKNIKKGEEIVWYYGDEYERDYKLDKSVLRDL